MGKLKSLIVVCIFLTVPAAVSAETWIPYGSNDYFEASLDVDSMKSTVAGLSSIRVWTKWDITQAGRVEMFGKNKNLKANAKVMKTKWLIICADQEIYEEANYVFDKKGQLLDSNTLKPAQRLDVIPGTMVETLFNKSCDTFKKNDRQAEDRNQASGAPPAPAPLDKNVNSQAIKEGVSSFAAIVKESGMNGAISLSRECYAVFVESPTVDTLQLCAAIDFSASIYDSEVIKANKWSADKLMPYFLEENVIARISEGMTKSKITRKKERDDLLNRWFNESQKMLLSKESLERP